MLNSVTISICCFQPVPCTELGPAAHDVCKNGFTYEPFPDAAATTAMDTEGSTETVVSGVDVNSAAERVGHKRTAAALQPANASTSVHSADTITADAPSAGADITSANATGTAAPFGNDSKRPVKEGGSYGSGRGPNKTGKTEAEKLQLRAYLRQGVDR
jgi:hypothetical protein